MYGADLQYNIKLVEFRLILLLQWTIIFYLHNWKNIPVLVFNIDRWQIQQFKTTLATTGERLAEEKWQMRWDAHFNFNSNKVNNCLMSSHCTKWCLNISLSRNSPFNNMLICFYNSFMQDDDNEGIQVSNEMANRMSLFYAYPTPLLKTLSDATSKFVTEVIRFCSILFA